MVKENSLRRATFMLAATQLPTMLHKNVPKKKDAE